MKKLLHLLRIPVFLLLLAVCLWGTSRIMQRKGSIERFEPFLSEADRYDVLLMGNSSMVNAVMPMDLWHDYGISSYNLACYGSFMPVTYWTAMNFLDYNTPKLIILDVRNAYYDKKIENNSNEAHTAFDCFPMSRTKYEAIKDLMLDSDQVDLDGNRYADVAWEFFFTLGKYHTRWSELTKEDLSPDYEIGKGHLLLPYVASSVYYEVIDETDAMEEVGPGFEYLRKFIEACKERNIPLLLVHTPSPSPAFTQRSSRACANIATEYDVPMIDFISDDAVCDYSVDMADYSSHMNPSGAHKVSDFLGSYLRNHYDLPDRSGDTQWAAEWDAYQDSIFRLAEEQEDARGLISLLTDPNISLCVAVRPWSSFLEAEQYVTLLHNIARERVYEEDIFDKNSMGQYPVELADESAYTGSAFAMLWDSKNKTLYQDFPEDDPTWETEFGTFEWSAAADVDRVDLTLTLPDGSTRALSSGPESDLLILAFDNRTGKLATVREMAAPPPPETAPEAAD